MTTPERVTPSQSPFERVANHFKEMSPASTGTRLKDYKRIGLADRRLLDIHRTNLGGPSEAYLVGCWAEPATREDFASANKMFGFAISPAGLESLAIPRVEFRIGNIPAFEKEGEFTYIKNDRNKTSIAKELVDWLDNVIKERRYTPPPISVSISL